jgi:hypothetical protein
MDITKQVWFVEQLNYKMKENSKNGLEFFIKEWPKLNKDDRKNLPFMLGFGVGQILVNSEISTEDRLHWLALYNYADKPIVDGKFVEDIDDDIFPRLNLASNINGNQITLVFRDLRDNGVITSSDESIAEAISIIFPIEYNTAYKDLTEKKRLQKVTRLLH